MSNYIDTNLPRQVQSDYLEYALATLSRAIPDIYDGLIPARRRILQTMIEQGLLPSKPYVKCARTTGMTSAYYHPHGSCYGSLISMATTWNNTLPWIDCHGNVGSTVDSPAAERYVENRLTTAAVEVLLQNRETWETRANYDGSRQEAVRLDAKVPTVLLNGTEGISVGYSTKVPQHNLRDICAAVAKEGELLPDFPTGCDIIRDEGLTEYVKTGSGTLRLRARHEVTILEAKGRAKSRPAVTFTNLPPNTNPESIGTQIKQALDKGQLDGITEVIDLSNLAGDCVQVVGKPGIDAAALAEQLYLHTSLESTYSARNLVLDGTRPIQLPSSAIIAHWKTWRLDRLRVQFEHERGLKESRLEVVQGLIRATDMIDKVVAAIRKADSVAAARIALVSKPFAFTRSQAEAILEMRLRALTGLDAEALAAECGELEKRLEVLTQLVTSEAARTKHMLAEVKAVGVRHGEARRSQLITVAARVRAERGPAAPRVAKPRFVAVDMKKGICTQAKGPRSAIVLESTDKLILMTANGMLRKVASTFKGPIADEYSPVVLAKRGQDVVDKKYLSVFEYEGAIKAMIIDGADLLKTTSTGKRWLPPGAVSIHFGENSYTVEYTSNRKKPTVLTLKSVKPGKPGGKGIQVAKVNEVK